jgi:hypothetical protein
MRVTVIGPIHSSFRSYVYVGWGYFQRLLKIHGAFQMFAPINSLTSEPALAKRA